MMTRDADASPFVQTPPDVHYDRVKKFIGATMSDPQ